MIPNEKVLLYEPFKGHSELWLLEDIFDYMKNYPNTDPLGILKNPSNQYALERAKVYGLQNERRAKYARDSSGTDNGRE